MNSISYNGKYWVREASVGDIVKVTSDISRDEMDEARRLGIKDPLKDAMAALADNRVYSVVPTRPPYTPLVIFGANKEGYIWLLPTQHCIDHHGRMLANPRICRWFIEHCFELIDRDGGEPKVLFNGVTPEATRIIRWLKKSCGARFSNTPLPTTLKGADALPFFIDRPAHV